MDRDRDRRQRDGSVEWLGRGESYRPNRSPRRSPPRRSPARDSHRSERSPPRRPIPPADTYVPPRSSRPRSRSPAGYRRRSRSPRGDGASWRDRERDRDRSPPRRGYSPRADTYRRDPRDRSPRRDARYDDRYARSPVRRGRSPVPLKRNREVSPDGSRGARSPKRERLASPRERRDEATLRDASPPRRAYSPPRDRAAYRGRSRSPRREAYGENNWRRRSPSPPRDPRADYQAGQRSGRDSVATSRRSSPPPAHPSRPAQVAPEPRSPGYRRRSPSPTRRRDSIPSTREPPAGPSYRNGDSNFNRAPPTGPSGSRSFSNAMITPPSGPSMSAHSRVGNPILSAPSRPRGGGFGGGFGGAPTHPTRDYNSGPPAAPRRTSMQFTNPSYRPAGPAPRGPPTGPSAGPRPDPGFRGSSNSTSTTYPRTQRFRDHLSDLPQIIPGGKKMEDVYVSTKLQKMEEELEKMRQTIAAREAKLKPELNQWTKLERESEKAALKSQLADESLRGLSGEDGGGVAF